MAAGFQVSFDAADPEALGRFWAHVLDYVPQPPPPGFDSWDDALEAMGIDTSGDHKAFAIVDPDGKGPRFFFQTVPEGKTAKNRVHLDVNVGEDRMHAKADELVGFGAAMVEEKQDATGHWIVMRDPEGNEFCLQ